MARLPQPGGDAGNWGSILNDYLATAHKADGTIKDSSITASALAPDSVTNAALADDSVTATTIADGTITETLLASPLQTKLNAPATIADGSVTSTSLAASSVTSAALDISSLTDVAGITKWPNSSPIVQNVVADYTGRPGVAGTGTDNRAAIQAALNAASDPKPGDSSYYAYLADRSVVVTLPAGIYFIGAPSSGASLVVPSSVVFDASAATLVFAPPSVATQSWCAIEIRQYANLHIGKVNMRHGSIFPDTANVYDGIRLIATDNNSRVIGYKNSEVSGFQGAGIRGIGAYISHVKGIRFTNNRYGYIASNVGDGYGITYHSGMVAGRKHTEVAFSDCQFSNTNISGFVGVTSGLAANPNTIDFATSGLSVNFRSCSFEQIGGYAVSAGNLFNIGMDHCHLENVGNGDGMVSLNTVRVAEINDLQVNFAGIAAPAQSGSGTAIPNPSAIFKCASVLSLGINGLYCHNSYRPTFALFNGIPQRYRVAGVITDSYALTSAEGSRQMGEFHLPGTFDHPLLLGQYRLWVDTNGVLRMNSATPASATDGTVIGTQT